MLLRYLVLLTALFIFTDVFCQEDSLRNVQIHSIKIAGNRHTKSYIILRELNIRSGDTLKYKDFQKKLTKGLAQIYNTSLFVQVTSDTQLINTTSVDIYIFVKERWYIYPLPEFQIVDRSYNEWIQKYHSSLSRVNYGIKFVDYNLTGRKDQLRVSLFDGYSREVGLNYTAPYSNPKLTNGFTFGTGYAQTRELAYKTSFDNQLLYYTKNHFVRNSWNIQAGYSIRKAIKFSHNFLVRYNYINQDDSTITTAYNVHFLNSGSAKAGFTDLIYTFQYQDADNITYPLIGSTAKMMVQKRGFGWAGGLNMFSIQGEYDRYFSLGRKWYLAVQLAGMIKLPFTQSYINQQAFGYGKNYMQGLEQYVIDGVADVVGKINFRKELAKFSVPTIFKKSKTFNTIPFKIYGKVFGNAGYVYAQDEFASRLNNKFLYTSGVGVDIVTFYDVQIRLEYSFNQLGQKRLFLHNEKGF